MSFLRIRSPFHEPRDIPLGPAVGRRTFTRYGSRGGPVVVFGAMAVGESDRSKANRQTREYKARAAEEARARRPRCGKILGYIGEPCARTEGHKYDHKSAETMAAVAAGRAVERAAARIVKPTPAEREERRQAYFREWQRERRALGLR